RSDAVFRCRSGVVPAGIRRAPVREDGVTALAAGPGAVTAPPGSRGGAGGKGCRRRKSRGRRTGERGAVPRGKPPGAVAAGRESRIPLLNGAYLTNSTCSG